MYRWKGSLKSHVLDHHRNPALAKTISPPKSQKEGHAFPCPLPSCKSGFHRASDLHRHLNLKHPEIDPVNIHHTRSRETIICQYCSTFCSGRRGLVLHQKRCPGAKQAAQLTTHDSTTPTTTLGSERVPPRKRITNRVKVNKKRHRNDDEEEEEEVNSQEMYLDEGPPLEAIVLSSSLHEIDAVPPRPSPLLSALLASMPESKSSSPSPLNPPTINSPTCDFSQPATPSTEDEDSQMMKAMANELTEMSMNMAVAALKQIQSQPIASPIETSTKQVASAGVSFFPMVSRFSTGDNDLLSLSPSPPPLSPSSLPLDVASNVESKPSPLPNRTLKYHYCFWMPPSPSDTAPTIPTTTAAVTSSSSSSSPSKDTPDAMDWEPTMHSPFPSAHINQTPPTPTVMAS